MKQDGFCKLLELIADRLDDCFSEVAALDTDKLSKVLDSEQLKTALTWLRHYNYPRDAVELVKRTERIIVWFTQLNKMSQIFFWSKKEYQKVFPYLIL